MDAKAKLNMLRLSKSQLLFTLQSNGDDMELLLELGRVELQISTTNREILRTVKNDFDEY